MRLKILFVFFLAFSNHVLHAQVKSGVVNYNDSTNIYFFDLFNDKRVLDWGIIPKNFPFVNYRVYLKNNSLDTLKIGRVTTGDGRVSYQYNSKTRIIYPEEYVVLEPFHNSQINHRHGSFSRQVLVEAQTKDTVHRSYHNYKGQYSTDTIYKNFERITLHQPLSPPRKPVELAFDDSLRAETARKMAEIQREKEVKQQATAKQVVTAPVNNNPVQPVVVKKEPIVEPKVYNFYVRHLNEFVSSTVYIRTNKRLVAMGTEGTDLKYYRYSNYEKDSIMGLELVLEDGVSKINWNVDVRKGAFVFVNVGGQNHYFSSRDSCENFIKEATKRDEVSIRFRSGDTFLNHIESVQVLEKSVWVELDYILEESGLSFFYSCLSGPFKVQIRWRESETSEWNYDWLFMKRNRTQFFYRSKENTLLTYAHFGIVQIEKIKNTYQIDISGANLDNRTRVDSVKSVLKWYGIPYTSVSYHELCLENDEDRFRVNRALNKHFEKATMTPMVVGYGERNYLSKSCIVYFFGSTSDAKIKAYLKGLGLSEFYMRERNGTSDDHVEVSIVFDDVIQPKYSTVLNKLYHSELVYSVRTQIINIPKLDD